eukprot:3008597-Prymnesium_polylepis.1
MAVCSRLGAAGELDDRGIAGWSRTNRTLSEIMADREAELDTLRESLRRARRDLDASARRELSLRRALKLQLTSDPAFLLQRNADPAYLASPTLPPPKLRLPPMPSGVGARVEVGAGAAASARGGAHAPLFSVPAIPHTRAAAVAASLCEA